MEKKRQVLKVKQDQVSVGETGQILKDYNGNLPQFLLDRCSFFSIL
jgi:hypothetical protein